MLIQFSAENYMSIREKIVLSMLASKDNEKTEHLIIMNEKSRYLKSSVIYGANASGKSNVLNAFWYMINSVLTSHEKQINKQTGRIPFKFDAISKNNPSTFEVIFIHQGIRYAYGFSTTENQVVEEYLYHYGKGRQAIIFERKNVNEYRFTSDVDLQESLKERNSENKLYLSTAANWNYDKVKPVFEWFISCEILCKYSASNAYGIEAENLKNDDYRAAIAAELGVADFGIKSLEYDEKVLELALLKETGDFMNIRAIHQVTSAEGKYESYSLGMQEESDGTNSYFKLVGIVKRVLAAGGLLVADEIDAHLHPLLAKHIIGLFNSEIHNSKGAQLIFTSHNTNLLDLDIFRRDQIWFTEKSERTSATELFSLFDFSVRKDTKLERNYLLGRYGAIPFIKGGI